MNLFANTIIDLSVLITVLLLYYGGSRSPEQDLNQSIFDKMLFCVGGYILTDLIAWYIDGLCFAGAVPLQLAFNSLIYLFQIAFSYFGLVYTDFWIFRSTKRLKARRWAYAIPLIVETLLLIVNLFTGWIFRINEQGFYERQFLFAPIMLLFLSYGIFSIFLALRAFFAARDRARKVYCLWIMVFLIVPDAALVSTTMFPYGITVSAPFYALSLLMIYLNVHQKQLLEEKEKVAQREAELQKARTAIMLSQIQPHFLYNTLSTIRELCRIDPEQAEAAVIEFSDFLRGNLGSLSAQKPISFAQELEHTKHYLSLEKMRFGDRLNVEYSIETDLFRLPTLTLQPIVENAVRYGVTKREEGGTVSISSAESESAFIVTVRDNGIGFDTAALTAMTGEHIGIANVRERLKTVGGTLEISSSPGSGTAAVIAIPKEAEEC